MDNYVTHDFNIFDLFVPALNNYFFNLKLFKYQSRTDLRESISGQVGGIADATNGFIIIVILCMFGIMYVSVRTRSSRLYI